VLFTGGESGDKNSYMLAWLAAALGPFFGLIGVESGADVAEETKLRTRGMSCRRRCSTRW